MSPVALREAEAHGVALPLPRLLERAQLQRPVVALDLALDRLPGVVGRMAFDEDQLGAGAHHRRARQRRRDVARLVARRDDDADAGPPRRRRRAAIAQHVDPVHRRELHARRAHEVAVERARDARHLEGQQQAVLVAHHLQADDVEQVAEVGVGQPVRRRRWALPARHLRQPHRQLPQVIERGQVDAPTGRHLALEPVSSALMSSTLWQSRSQITASHDPDAADSMRAPAAAVASPTSKLMSG